MYRSSGIQVFNDDNDVESRHSFVEGDIFDTRRNEIEVMGGDPFFFTDDDDDDDCEETIDTAPDAPERDFGFLSDMAMATSGRVMDILQRANPSVPAVRSPSSIPSIEQTQRKMDSFQHHEIEALGGDSFFLSDDDIEQESGNPNLDDPPSEMDVLSEMAMSGGGVMNLLQGGLGAQIPDANQDLNDDFPHDVKSSQDDKEIDEVLDVGGDPFFLSSERMQGSDKEDDAIDEVLTMCGDPFFLSKGDTDGSQNVHKSTIDEVEPEEIDPSPMEMLSRIAALSSRGESGSMKILSEFQNDDLDSENDRFQEIEDIGGDPFFLDDAEGTKSPDTPVLSKAHSEFQNHAASGQRFGTDGQGPTPRVASEPVSEDEEWEWDGIVDEDAHFDLE